MTDGSRDGTDGGRRRADALVEELRALGLLALDRLDPLIGRLNEAVSTSGTTAAAAHGAPLHVVPGLRGASPTCAATVPRP